MKLTRLLILMLALCLLLTACGGETPIEEATTGVTTTTTTTAESTTTTTTTAAVTTESITESTTESTTAAPTTESTTTTTAAPTVAPTETPTQAPTAEVTTTSSSGKHVITYTTTTEATTTTKDKSKGKAIKLLAIGNSFSVDAMNNHLYEVFESAGYTDITLGNLYIGGCSLDMHYGNLKSGAAAYEFYLNTDGYWDKKGGATLATGLNAANWDVITIQQVSSDSGRPALYSNLKDFTTLLKQKKPRAKILWHMTWAYQQNSPHEAFAHYNNDQMTMYQAITDTVQAEVLPQAAISGIIPAGTAIQNLRTSALGDTLTSDGHHLKDTYGDYTAALTWFCTITGESPEKVTYWPGTVSDQKEAILQSVKNALKKPFVVTKCK